MPSPEIDDALRRHNEVTYGQVVDRRDDLLGRHQLRRDTVRPPDPLGGFIDKVRTLLPGTSGVAVGEILVDQIERARFGADLALKFPGLLKDGGPRRFATEHAPAIRSAMEGPEFADEVANVDSVGMYINVRLRDDWLLTVARSIAGAGPSYGRSYPLAAGRFVLDYSSPNVAKSLHAGHIRSTIIGAVLSNLLEAAGGLVFRINHINDYGGFGFLLEGQRRFEHSFPPGSDLNERSLEIYRLRRILERAIADGASVADLPGPDADLVHLVLPGVEAPEDLKAAMEEFAAAADRRFAALETGDPEEVGLWKQIVVASLEEFSSFYRSLDITFDFVIGESFYAQLGLQLVDEWLRSGAAVLVRRSRGGRRSPPPAGLARRRRDLRQRVRVPRTGHPQGHRRGRGSHEPVRALRGQTGRRSEHLRHTGPGRGRPPAEALRARPAVIYVVGQEQKTHFERLFAASYQLGLADPARTTFDHIYFGFYVDAHTHKKLSSRESATGVAELFEVAQSYFRSRVSDRLVEVDEDPDDVARQLTIASHRVQRPQAGHPLQRRDGHEKPDRHGGGVRQVGRRLRHLHGLSGGQHRPQSVGAARGHRPRCRQRPRPGRGAPFASGPRLPRPSSPTRPSNETRPCWSGTCSI